MSQAKLVPVERPERAVAGEGGFDAVVLVAPDPRVVSIDALRGPVEVACAADAKATESVSVLPVEGVAGGRLVLSPTGPVSRDQDDVRRFADAAALGVRRARDAGARAPLLLIGGVPGTADFARAAPVTALAAVGCLWEPLEAREARGDEGVEPVSRVGFGVLGGSAGEGLAAWVDAVEAGRRLARDLAGTEPERMAPPRFAEDCVAAFAGTGVEVEVVDDAGAILRDYPLIAAVARASSGVARHRPRVVRLAWRGEGPIARTVLLAGKGVTYDTGGADLKVGGAMAGMSRDKGGAAAVAGFVRAVAGLRPTGLAVMAEIGAVRNSIGADAFVSDEIITSHAGVRVRIGNTDAEGRLVLADLLSHLRERALGAPSPTLLSVATLTGHAARAIGSYTSALDNGPALAAGIARALAEEGDRWGDPFDPQRLRREDWEFVRPRTAADDVLSCNNAASAVTARGHQFPMAFLAIASGLDRHGRDARQPLGYTHVDVAGSAIEGGDWQHGRPTARPIVAFLAALAGALPPD